MTPGSNHPKIVPFLLTVPEFLEEMDLVKMISLQQMMKIPLYALALCRVHGNPQPILLLVTT